MMTLARPHTTMPMPICTSAKPWYCASSAPDSADQAVGQRQPERSIMLPTFTPRARIICVVVAGRPHRRPRSVRKKT